MLTFCRHFADDNSFQHAAINVQDIEFNLNQDLLNLEIWCKKWLLSFNPSKTKSVHFNIKKNTVNPLLKFQDRDLEFVSSHKHLGVIFS